ncbi:MAG: thiamine pyrophosphate-dependent enzyme, partial [Deltaproteobacteria bacterium]|nr:thiamine pyrophosphate-dependent enzyme [Deltaproteobacteria bacterium]
MGKRDERVLMGNEAIARGLVENGCTLFASYPGTPASEILPAVVQFSRETGARLHTEWSVNEKVAYEVALANSMAGRRSAVAMKQVGLNVASDPLTRSAYLGVVGGFIAVVADDPGPHSSQTEQDSRFFAQFAKIPVFDPSSPREAKEMIEPAYALSEKYEIPVMLRPTTRICHSRQNIPCAAPRVSSGKADFKKNPGRWIATPQFLTELHRLLNEKLEKISQEETLAPRRCPGDGPQGKELCIISSGVAYAHTREILEDMGVMGDVDLYQVVMPYPLNRDFAERVNRLYKKILVVEETYPVIEMQLSNSLVEGRRSGIVPGQGELTPDVIEEVLEKFLGRPSREEAPARGKGVRPTLCAGCPHRATFYAIKETFPKGIFPSDIGCYTLGMNLGAIDTCHVMGACISQGAGFYHAYARDGKDMPTIVVTIGDSTFFHAGIPALVNAVFQGAKFILVILDNATTAMTGNQPTPQVGIRADGKKGTPVSIADLVKACGVRFVRSCDPYETETFSTLLKEADAHTRKGDGGMAVIIAKHPCVLDLEAMKA